VVKGKISLKRHSGEACAGLDPVAGIQQLQRILDAGSVIPDLIRDRHDKFGIFCETNKGFQFSQDQV
jgi:hypothetical protein